MCPDPEAHYWSIQDKPNYIIQDEQLTAKNEKMVRLSVTR